MLYASFIYTSFQLWAKRLKYNMLPACFLGLTKVLSKQAACSTMLTEKLVLYMEIRENQCLSVATSPTGGMITRGG
jgi:hypothetical protein